MSRKVSDDKYKKTLSHKLETWFYGSEDVYVNHVEMKPQHEFLESEETIRARENEKQKLLKNIYDVRHNKELKLFGKSYKFFCVFFCCIVVFTLLIAVSHMPTFGNPNNPVHNEVAERYIESGMQETGAVNIVTGMILDYRAFDTLGESHVLFVATCTVLILLRDDKKKRVKKIQTRLYKDKILQTITKVLVPPILIFGLYIILAGHLGPGGGFAGGAIIGAAFILYSNAFGFEKTSKFFNANTYKWTSFCALACYSISKCYSFYTGANHIHSIIPLGIAGNLISSGLIFVLNICVGIVVAGTMYTLYVLFRKGGY